MEYLEGFWETLKGNQRCRFRGTVRLTVTSLEHPELPARVLEEPMEWIQPTPTPFVLVKPVQVVIEEDFEEDLEDELEVQQLAPDADMLPEPEEDAEPVIELDPMEEAAPEPAVESVEESGPRWLVESDKSDNQDYRLEWMASAHSSCYPRSSTIPTLPLAVEVVSSQSSSEFAVVPDIDKRGLSGAAIVVISSNSNSMGDTDSSSVNSQ